jgi:hypothetical protein
MHGSVCRVPPPAPAHPSTKTVGINLKRQIQSVSDLLLIGSVKIKTPLAFSRFYIKDIYT